jgi:hydrogenase maturation factor
VTTGPRLLAAVIDAFDRRVEPVYVANEGRLVAFVAPESADAILASMRA